MKHLNPVNYYIHLKPDLVKFTFGGSVNLLCEAEKPLDTIKLNILDIAVWSCEVGQDDRFEACSFQVGPQKEELQIFLPRPMEGNIRVKIDYEGRINDQMAGFYRSKYVSPGATQYICVTQFEESDARRAFPCVDHPSKKATFDIEMDMDKDLVAVSNGPVKQDTLLETGKKRVSFEQTPKMSTYLLFFGIGGFEITADEKDKRVRAVTLPGMKKYGQFGLEFGRKSLGFSEAYYGIAYPLSKLDLIAIPDFAFGAMENWGAITFRENLLLHYPGVTSKLGEQRICEVIAHEIAHQWFGNLVTPCDWKYLWLNESFATYFGYHVVDHFYPKWETWEQFIYGQTETAMARDALRETFAIEIPGGEHVVINVSTAPIIYSKGGSILRQIEAYIGKDHFKRGLHHYLKTYEYACAASHHLWESIEKVSNLPISEMMRSWIEQPGFPMLDVKREGNRILLTQKRFSCLPVDCDQIWLIPVTISLFSADGDIRQVKTLMDAAQMTIEIPDCTVDFKVNDGQAGFYIVRYDDPLHRDRLGKRVRNKSLAVEDRWGLQNDLFFLCRSGEASLNDYLTFLDHYANEDAFLPLMSISDHLKQAFLVGEDEEKEKITSFARPWFEDLLERIGHEPGPDEKQTTSILRDQLIWHAALYGSEIVMEFSRRQFSRLMQRDKIHPDIMKSVMQVGAFTEGGKAFDWLGNRFQSAESEHERMNILIALGAFKESVQIEKSLRYVLENVPPRNKFVPVTAMASNPFAVPLMWDWYVSNLEQIEQFHPMMYERIIAAIVPVAGLEDPEAIKTFFQDYMKRTDKAKDVIKLSLERLEINIRMRKSR